MFCDLAGSTALSLKLDPEDLQVVIEHYREACQRVLRRWDGVIARYLGDGLLIYFGYPVAHEDDARRAAAAGLEIVEAIRNLHPPVGGNGQPSLEVRIGIHTGLVVAGDIGQEDIREDSGVIGATPNLAARLQAEAEPGQVLVSSETSRLIERTFRVKALEPRSVKGFDQPLEMFQILEPRSGSVSFVQDQHVAALVGREQELGRLRSSGRRWRKATARP